FMQGLEFPLTF
nr:immunoglobulin light chain junction region [Macaca mulatta]